MFEPLWLSVRRPDPAAAVSDVRVHKLGTHRILSVTVTLLPSPLNPHHPSYKQALISLREAASFSSSTTLSCSNVALHPTSAQIISTPARTELRCKHDSLLQPCKLLHPQHPFIEQYLLPTHTSMALFRCGGIALACPLSYPSAAAQRGSCAYYFSPARSSSCW